MPPVLSGIQCCFQTGVVLAAGFKGLHQGVAEGAITILIHLALMVAASAAVTLAVDIAAGMRDHLDVCTLDAYIGNIQNSASISVCKSVPGRQESQHRLSGVRINAFFWKGVALPLGSELEALEERFSFSPYTLQCETERGKTVTASIEWDFSGVDLQTVGVYPAVGTVLPPENTAFGEGIPLPEIAVPISVQQPGRPELNCLLAAGGRWSFLGWARCAFPSKG